MRAPPSGDDGVGNAVVDGVCLVDHLAPGRESSRESSDDDEAVGYRPVYQPSGDLLWVSRFFTVICMSLNLTEAAGSEAREGLVDVDLFEVFVYTGWLD